MDNCVPSCLHQESCCELNVVWILYFPLPVQTTTFFCRFCYSCLRMEVALSKSWKRPYAILTPQSLSVSHSLALSLFVTGYRHLYSQSTVWTRKLFSCTFGRWYCREQRFVTAWSIPQKNLQDRPFLFFHPYFPPFSTRNRHWRWRLQQEPRVR